MCAMKPSPLLIVSRLASDGEVTQAADKSQRGSQRCLANLGLFLHSVLILITYGRTPEMFCLRTSNVSIGVVLCCEGFDTKLGDAGLSNEARGKLDDYLPLIDWWFGS